MVDGAWVFVVTDTTAVVCVSTAPSQPAVALAGYSSCVDGCLSLPTVDVKVLGASVFVAVSEIKQSVCILSTESG